jgi:ubiquitin fusion degradation protein 1
MLQADLAAAARSLKARTDAFSESQRRRAARVAAAAARQAARAAALEEANRARRLAAAAAEAARDAAREAELEANRGVWFHADLVAVAAPEALAAGRGIRRAADKALLPPSAGAALMDQGAHRNGPMYFEVATPDGAATHVALLEFTSAEGFAALPPKAAAALFGAGATAAAAAGEDWGRVHVAYRLLPKGERAVFQPLSAAFQRAAAADEAAGGGGVRGALERALASHSVLSVGDRVGVAVAGEPFELRVRELEPAAAVSVIDTDLEAEIHPSVEAEERARAEEAAAAARLSEAATAAAAAARVAAEADAAEAEAAAAREAGRALAAAALPPEPPAGGAATAVMVRFPDGGRAVRRFLPEEQSLDLVFDFVDAQAAGARHAAGGYRLVTQYPRRVFDRGGGAAAQTLHAAGLGAGTREVLFLEPMAADGGVAEQS